MASESRATTDQAERRAARILLGEDLQFSESRLSEILVRAGHAPIVNTSGAGIAPYLCKLEEGVDLMVLSLSGGHPEMLRAIREIRSSARARMVPILGVASFDGLEFDLQLLRSHGIVGLVDRRASPETVLRRVEQIVRPMGQRRVCERTPCFLPAELVCGSSSGQEYALNLSASGMRLTSIEPLEPNTELGLRFRLPMIAEDLIDATARLVHRTRLRNSAGRWEIGVFFYPLEPEHGRIVDAEVARLLAG